ncbi:unnamed protein product [Discosporangium mesarthrocarpum]
MQQTGTTHRYCTLNRLDACAVRRKSGHDDPYSNAVARWGQKKTRRKTEKRTLELGLAAGTTPMDVESYQGQGQYRLMLVDDEDPLRRAVSEYLEQRGYHVTTHESAMDALSTLQDSSCLRPDLIITDINMPGIDGFQFLMQLRSTPVSKRIPVIFLTARGMTQDRILGYRAGVNAYIPKPFDPEELVSIVDNLLVNRDLGRGSSGDLDVDELRRELVDIKAMLTSGPSKGATHQLKSANPLPTESLPMLPTDDVVESIPKVSLTPRELEVLRPLIEGYTNREIAEQLNVGIRSVEKRVSNMLAKTGTTNRTELVRFCQDWPSTTL